MLDIARLVNDPGVLYWLAQLAETDKSQIKRSWDESLIDFYINLRNIKERPYVFEGLRETVGLKRIAHKFGSDVLSLPSHGDKSKEHDDYINYFKLRYERVSIILGKDFVDKFFEKFKIDSFINMVYFYCDFFENPDNQRIIELLGGNDKTIEMINSNKSSDFAKLTELLKEDNYRQVFVKLSAPEYMGADNLIKYASRGMNNLIFTLPCVDFTLLEQLKQREDMPGPIKKLFDPDFKLDEQAIKTAREFLGRVKADPSYLKNEEIKDEELNQRVAMFIIAVLLDFYGAHPEVFDKEVFRICLFRAALGTKLLDAAATSDIQGPQGYANATLRHNRALLEENSIVVLLGIYRHEITHLLLNWNGVTDDDIGDWLGDYAGLSGVAENGKEEINKWMDLFEYRQKYEVVSSGDKFIINGGIAWAIDHHFFARAQHYAFYKLLQDIKIFKNGLDINWSKLFTIAWNTTMIHKGEEGIGIGILQDKTIYRYFSQEEGFSFDATPVSEIENKITQLKWLQSFL
jgi:hypothetical protein